MSLLSVNELVLVSNLVVLGVASGTVAYQMRETEYPESSQKMKRITRDRTQILHSAYARMEDHAKQLGASGIIGIHTTHHEIARDLWEYTVQGTAIAGCLSGTNHRPFSCTLTGQEYAVLTAGRYRPVGVALGVCVYYQKYHQRVQGKITGTGWISAANLNTERSDFTRGLYTARRAALSALEAEAVTLGAAGVLGISVTTKRTLNHHNAASEGMMIEFTAFGTAIVADGPDTLTVDYALPLIG